MFSSQAPTIVAVEGGHHDRAHDMHTCVDRGSVYSHAFSLAVHEALLAL